MNIATFTYHPNYIRLLAEEKTLASENLRNNASMYDILPGTTSLDSVAVAGSSGNLFIADGSNQWEKQYKGVVRLSDHGLETWGRAISKRVELASSIGASLVHLVIPEKTSVLPHLRWPETDERPIDCAQRPILSLLEGYNSNLVYPLAELQHESPKSDLFFLGNSHFCLSGMWIIFCVLARSIWKSIEFDFSRLCLGRKWVSHDLVSKFHHPPPVEQTICLTRVAPVHDNKLFALRGVHIGNHLIFRNNLSVAPEVVVVFGDSHSFDAGLVDIISNYFRECHFIWSSTIDFDYCARVSAQFIIVETAERYLLQPHDSDFYRGEIIRYRSP